MSQHHAVIAGIDLGDRYGHLCLIDAENGDVRSKRAGSPRAGRLSRGAFRTQGRCAWPSRRAPTRRG
jgi:hypothetical protein